MEFERRKRVGFPRFNEYNAAFKYVLEQGFHLQYVKQPPLTRRTMEMGALHSPDYVCAPFKTLLGSYIEALEAGAELLIFPGGPCRLGYYGALFASILKDLGYQFEYFDYATLKDMPKREFYALARRLCPGFKLTELTRAVPDTIKIIRYLDDIEARFHQNCGFEVQPGSFQRAYDRFLTAMYAAENGADVRHAYQTALSEMEALPVNKPEHPIRVGVIGEYFTVMDPFGNLDAEKKLASFGVEVHRHINMTHFNLELNEKNLRNSIRDYVHYSMGPTSTENIAAALNYVKQGFGGVVHIKSSGCTPEIDIVPTLQRISREYQVPFLFLSYDTQSSDTGLDTRLEAFYDMIAMKRSLSK